MTVWTKCSDEMPPDDSTSVIIRGDVNSLNYPRIRYGMVINTIHRANQSYYDKAEWTPYTDELWNGLNK